MSFFDLEVLKEKLILSKRIMHHLKLSKTYDFGTKNLKKQKNCNSYELLKIWSNFEYSKVPNY
jgi:hypothetical protein